MLPQELSRQDVDTDQALVRTIEESAPGAPSPLFRPSLKGPNASLRNRLLRVNHEIFKLSEIGLSLPQSLSRPLDGALRGFLAELSLLRGVTLRSGEAAAARTPSRLTNRSSSKRTVRTRTHNYKS